jgi:transcriptional regulator with XRE-family HTH domain
VRPAGAEAEAHRPPEGAEPGGERLGKGRPRDRHSRPPGDRNTISRWESGRDVQTEAMEMLLRLLRDLPGSLDYLRQHAA